MVDQISGNGLPQRAALQLSNGKARVDPGAVAEGRPAAPARETGSATVRLSPVAKELAAQAPIDSGKVASLKAAISEGRYPIDPGAIASAMIRSEKA